VHKILTEAFIDGLTSSLPNINLQIESPDLITGVSFDVYPWHEYVALSFQTSEERWELGDDVAAWKHFEILRSDRSGSPKLQHAVCKMIEYYNEEGEDRTELFRAHVIFGAAACALLSKKVAAELVALGLEVRPYMPELLLLPEIDFIVRDVDGTLALNYCQLVIANDLSKAFNAMQITTL
jgi:hypothetical protein